MQAFVLNEVLQKGCGKDVSNIVCKNGKNLFVGKSGCIQTAKALNLAVALHKEPSEPNYSSEDVGCNSNGYLTDQTLCDVTADSLGQVMEHYAEDNSACFFLELNSTAANSVTTITTKPAVSSAVVLIVFEALDFDTLMPVVLRTGITGAIDATHNMEGVQVAVAFSAGSVVATVTISDGNVRATVEDQKQAIKKNALDYYLARSVITDGSIVGEDSDNQASLSTVSIALIVVGGLLACFGLSIAFVCSQRKSNLSARRTSQVNFNGAPQQGVLPQFVSSSQIAWSPGTLGTSAASPITETPFPLMEPDGLIHKSQRVRSNGGTMKQSHSQSMIWDELADDGLYLDTYGGSFSRQSQFGRESIHSVDRVTSDAAGFTMQRARSNSLANNNFSPDKLFSDKRGSQKFGNQATVRLLSEIPDDIELTTPAKFKGSNHFMRGAYKHSTSSLVEESSTDPDKPVAMHSGAGESTTDDVYNFRQSFTDFSSTDPSGMLHQQAQLLAAIDSFEADADVAYGDFRARSTPPAQRVGMNKRQSSSTILFEGQRRNSQRFSIDLVTSL